MMYQKALLFNDMDVAVAILNADTPGEQKKLGRMVSNFDTAVWNKHCLDIVFRGNMAKFSQNKKMYDAIMCPKFAGKEFVEASPVDSIWGIGLDEAKARRIDPSQWRGKNLLGKTLTRVRDELQAQAESATTISDDNTSNNNSI